MFNTINIGVNGCLSLLSLMKVHFTPVLIKWDSTSPLPLQKSHLNLFFKSSGFVLSFFFCKKSKYTFVKGN